MDRVDYATQLDIYLVVRKLKQAIGLQTIVYSNTRVFNREKNEYYSIENQVYSKIHMR